MTQQIDTNWHYPEKGEYPVAFGEYKQKVYPQIPCLVFHRGRYGVRFWNCIEECWDEEDGDDFFCSKDSVEEWMYIDALEQEQPKVDVNKHAVTVTFLHCERAGKIVSEMYGEQFNNIPRNIDRYLAFLKQVELDDRFGELAEILQRYGAMPKPKEQPEADLEAEVERWWNERYAKLKKDYKFDSMSGHYFDNETIIALARHFAEWGAVHLNVRKEE